MSCLAEIRCPLRRRLVAVAIAPLLLLAASSQVAVAADPVEEVTQLNRKALEQYQAQSFEDARKLLKQALDLCGASGLDQHPIKARTHVHLGIVIIGGFKQRELGMKQFKKALEIQSDIKLTKAISTPEMEQAFEDAKSDMAKGPSAGDAGGGQGPAGPGPEPGTPPGPPPSSQELTHRPITTAEQSADIPVTVSVSPGLQFDKLVLAYRADGAADFSGRDMQKAGDVYSAEIPRGATGGGVVAYYIEAQDATGAPLASAGSPDSPFIVRLRGEQADAGGDDDDDDDDEDEYPRLFFQLAFGSGVGWASGAGDLNVTEEIDRAGPAPATLGHAAPEVGYWIRPNLMLSVQGRFQTIPGTTDVTAGGKTYHAANYAAAVFAKATWVFGAAKFQPFFSLAAGAGRIRHVVSLAGIRHPTMCGSGDETCVDTISAGPALAGVGGGFFFNFGKQWMFVMALNSQVGAPDFTVNLDANIGLAFRM